LRVFVESGCGEGGGESSNWRRKKEGEKGNVKELEMN